MIKISQKKKTKPTKWNRTHEFQRKKSNRKGVGHPVYIYGKRARSFKYLLFTHKPPEGEEADFDLLKHNIDPDMDGKEPSYVRKKYLVDRHNAFEAPDKKYRIHDEDRETIKRYKK